MAKLLVSLIVVPILTEVAWSKGKYDSYVLYPNGLLIVDWKSSSTRFCMASEQQQQSIYHT
jgi:hypothetical protein